MSCALFCGKQAVQVSRTVSPSSTDLESLLPNTSCYSNVNKIQEHRFWLHQVDTKHTLPYIFHIQGVWTVLVHHLLSAPNSM